MQSSSVVVLLVLVAAAWSLPAEDYSTRYDTVDIDQILASERLLNNYFNCLMDRGACTAEGTELKSVLPDALENNCSRCSAKQKAASEKVFRHLSTQRVSQWNELLAKYDPSGMYRRRYEAMRNMQ